MQSSPDRSCAGLSLAEVVLGLVVILILVAMLFPLTGGPTEGSASQRKADQDIRIIVNAVQNYYLDYGEYPINDSRPKGDVPGDFACGDKAASMEVSNAALFNILLDLDRPPNTGHVRNRRR